jgi:small-conductance mechanosensitive channel
MNNKLKPALIGGVVLGVLSVIPIVNWVNLCCCLWAILGGMLASYLYIKNSPTPATAGDGAMVGVFAGLVGGAIAVVIGIPVSLLVGATMNELLIRLAENVSPEQAQVMRGQMAVQTVTSAIVRGLIGAVLLFVFAIIGGLIGVPLFEKRKGNLTPPPPSGAEGVGGGYAA